MQQGLAVVPFRGAVKALVLANVAIWFFLVALPGVFHFGLNISEILGLVPEQVLHHFWIWQPFTYMFLHSGVSHILFNMLTLWFFGTELEERWGRRFFLNYYFVCGVGAAAVYMVGTTLYSLITNNPIGLFAPLIGASGATFGLLLAYGILFGERVILFMMLFPMKAKYFVLIIGLVELMTMMDAGSGAQVSNLAHLGGIVVGFLFLNIVARYRASARGSGAASRRGRKLKLVVDNERDQRSPEKKDQQGPKYWN